LAGQPIPGIAAEDGQKLGFLGGWRLEQLLSFEDFHVTRPAARRSAREWDRRQVLVAYVDQLAAIGHLDALVSPNGIRLKLDGRHALAA
jgi:hypothetical protein